MVAQDGSLRCLLDEVPGATRAASLTGGAAARYRIAFPTHSEAENAKHEDHCGRVFHRRGNSAAEPAIAHSPARGFGEGRPDAEDSLGSSGSAGCLGLFDEYAAATP